jgi:hypothetical protein
VHCNDGRWIGRHRRKEQVVVMAYLVSVPDSARVLLPMRLLSVYPVAVHVFADAQDTPMR